MEKLVPENQYKNVVPLFVTDLDLYQQCQALEKIEEIKDFSRPVSDFSLLYKADLIYKDFSRKPSKFKYFFKPVLTLNRYRNLVHWPIYTCIYYLLPVWSNHPYVFWTNFIVITAKNTLEISDNLYCFYRVEPGGAVSFS